MRDEADVAAHIAAFMAGPCPTFACAVTAATSAAAIRYLAIARVNFVHTSHPTVGWLSTYHACSEGVAHALVGSWLLRNRASSAAIHLDNGRRTAGMKLRPTLASGCLCRNQMQRRRCMECRKNTGCAQWPHKAMARASRY